MRQEITPHASVTDLMIKLCLVNLGLPSNMINYISTDHLIVHSNHITAHDSWKSRQDKCSYDCAGMLPLNH